MTQKGNIDAQAAKAALNEMQGCSEEIVSKTNAFVGIIDEAMGGNTGENLTKALDQFKESIAQLQKTVKEGLIGCAETVVRAASISEENA